MADEAQSGEVIQQSPSSPLDNHTPKSTNFEILPLSPEEQSSSAAELCLDSPAKEEYNGTGSPIKVFPCSQTSIKEMKLTVLNNPRKADEPTGTKLKFVRTVEDKPKGGYFNPRVLNLSPKKEDDPFSIANLVRNEIPNTFNFELIPGEIILINEDSFLITDKRKDDGKIIFTNYQLCFLTKDLKKVSIPHGYIAKLERNIETRPVVYSTIDVTLKMGTLYKFKFSSAKQISINIFKIMGKLLYCEISEVFAYSYCQSKKFREITTDPHELAIMGGWDTFDWRKDLRRMEVNWEEDSPFRLVVNRQGRVCISYPEYFIVPTKVTDDILQKSKKFRSKDRIPVLSYALHVKKQRKFVCLWRSSQFKFNPNNPRSLSDEEYVKQLGHISSDPASIAKGKNLVIVDMRMRSGAVGMIVNSSKNVGFPIENYKNAVMMPIEYQNYQTLKQSYNKMVAACNAIQPSKWVVLAEQSKWYQYVFELLSVSNAVAAHLRNQQNVLLQCIEGTDRTTQVSALVQILLDPYYRTIDGFAVLVEKQFISFGHPFNIRLGLKKDKDSGDRAPVFIQFLDAVSQLVKQFPLSFQFTCKYLARIAYELYTNKYGNFLCSNLSQQLDNKIFQGTLSIWNQINQENNNLYSNPFYCQAKETDMYELKPCVSLKGATFFRQHFLKITSESKDDYGMDANAEDNQDYLSLLHRKCIQDIQIYRSQLSDQVLQIQKLKQQLAECLEGDINL